LVLLADALTPFDGDAQALVIAMASAIDLAMKMIDQNAAHQAGWPAPRAAQ
jgi:hypothetical protein